LRTCSINRAEQEWNDGFIPARSRHPGGVNALWLDGAVRFVRDQVNPDLWRALSTRSGGEVVDISSLP
jgi:prepilin-type processing-associated H-X9-DG protein